MKCDTNMPDKPTCSGPDGSQPSGSKKKPEWFLYLIYSMRKKRTYIGISTNPKRRLRQHNREIVGGARATSGATDWEHILILGGFVDKSSACRWEKLLKCRVRGLDKRKEAMLLLLIGICPPGRKHYTVPTNLYPSITI